MPSPICLVNSTATTDGVDVASSSSVTIQLADTSGVKQWSLICINTDDLHSKSVINSALSVNQVTKTATFTTPDAGSDGAAFIFESKINNGIDINGRTDSTLTARFGVYILTGADVRVAALDETTEGNAEFGWVVKFNDVIRNFGGGDVVGPSSAGNGLTFSGSAYNVAAGDSSITINADSIQVGTISAAQHGNQTSGTIHAAATTSVAGFMSAVDKTKLDNAVSTATASRLAIRDGSGNCSFATVTATTGAITTVNATTVNATTAGITGTGTIATLNSTTGTITNLTSTGISTSTLTASSTVGLSGATTISGTTTLSGATTASNFTLSSTNKVKLASRNSTRVFGNWTVNHLNDWAISAGYPQTTSALANIAYMYLNLPHNSIVTTIVVYIDPVSHVNLPTGMPSIRISKAAVSDGVITVIADGTDTSPDITAYNARHTITCSGGGEVINRNTHSYFLTFFSEYDSNAIAGLSLQQATIVISVTEMDEY